MQPSCLLSPPTIASEQTYATCTAFLRMPRKMSAVGSDVAILGIPFVLGTSNRPGARLGPAAIRTASSGFADLKAMIRLLTSLAPIWAMSTSTMAIRTARISITAIPKTLVFATLYASTSWGCQMQTPRNNKDFRSFSVSKIW